MAPDSAPGSEAATSPWRTGRTPGNDLSDSQAHTDMRALRGYRLERVRQQLRARDYAGILLYDPINIRYATGTRNMAVWTLHNAVRYAFVPVDGPVVLFDFHNCGHLSQGIETVAEVRPAIAWFYFGAGARVAEKARQWAAEIADLVAAQGANRRLAIDKCEPAGAFALTALGIEIAEGQEVMEQARSIKSMEELACMRQAIAVCETAMAQLREAVRPGVSENQLWAILNAVNAARGGELVSFDTDMIGLFGYCADISRTFFCGPGRPSDEQRRLYRLACEQIHANMAILRAGLGFRELAERAWKLPASCQGNRYSVVVHGVGLCDEYPAVVYLEDFEAAGYDGRFEAGMTVCVESYMGEENGNEGVKLEQQVLITEQGVELLSPFPFDESLLGREV